MTENPVSPSRFLLLQLPIAAGAGAFFTIRFGLNIPLWLLPAVFLPAAILGLFERSRSLALLLVPLCSFITAAQRATHLSPPSDSTNIANRIKITTEAGITGIVREMVVHDRERAVVVIDCERIILKKGRDEACRGRLRLTLWGKISEDITPGDRIMARARLRPADTIMTPGVVDFRTRLAARGIWTTGTVRKGLLIKLSDPGHSRSPVIMITRARQKLAATINAAVSDQTTAAIYRALLIGDNSGISPKTRKTFTHTGTIHLLAISGMHIGIIFLGLTLLLRGLMLSRPVMLLRFDSWKIAALGAMPIVFIYALLAGLKPPVFRAAIMIAVLIYALSSDRRHHILAAIGLAATVIILTFPASIMSASFQLSFAAVTAIIISWQRLSPWLERLAPVNRVSRFIISAALAGIAAQAGTLPFSLYHFNMISPLGVPVTIALIPLLCLWALPLGLTALALGPILPTTAATILKTGSLGIKIATTITTALAANPNAVLFAPTPPLFLIAAYIAAFILIFAYLKKPAPFLIAMILLPFIFIAVNSLTPVLTRDINPDPRTVFLDIGPGSATIIFTPGGKTWIVDGGGMKSKKFDPGAMIIAPFLFRQGISRLDGVVITHPHADHYNGLGTVMAIFKPQSLWINGRRGDQNYRRLIARAEKNGVRIKKAHAGEIIFREKDARLECLKDGDSGRDTNSASLVLLYRRDGRNMLLPGDIPPPIQARLANNNILPRCDIILAPHHGSPAYFNAAFFTATAAKTVVISKGSNNTIAPGWYTGGWKKGGNLWITSDHGTVETRMSAAGIRVRLPYGNRFRPR